MTAEGWDNGTRCFGMLLDGRGQATGIKRRGADTSLLIVFNAHHEAVKFTLPPTYEAEGWKRLFDTTDPKLAAAQFDIGAVYDVTARSMLLFERVPEKTDRQAASERAVLLGQQHGKRKRLEPVFQGDAGDGIAAANDSRTTDLPAIAPPRSTAAPPRDARGSAQSGRLAACSPRART